MYIAPPKPGNGGIGQSGPSPEAQVLGHYIENDYGNVLNESGDAISVKSCVVYLGTHTIGKRGRLFKSGLIGGGASWIATKILGGLAGGFAVGVVVSLLAACLDNSPAAGT